MTVSSEGIAAIIVALAGLVSGLYNLMQARHMKAIQDLETTEKQVDALRDDKREADRLLELAMRHIHAQNLVMARHGIEEVRLPPALQ
jgi:hypothetical protein